MDRIELIEAMPKTSVGKIDKKALRRLLSEPQPAQSPG
jgi:non-ribosomal peptide synthetase component E (peptide arylation enzyme)